MNRLAKAEVEVLMAAIETELMLDALSFALRRVLGVDAYDGDWGALVSLAADHDGWSAERRTKVVSEDPVALAELVVELNERRGLG